MNLRAFLRSTVAALGRCRAPHETPDASPASDLLTYALTLHQAGRLEEALPLYRKAVDLDPASDVAHNLMGTLFCAQGNLTEGEQSFRLALQVNPSNASALNNLANVCKDQGNLDAAETLYRQAAALQPTASAIHVNLGILALVRNRLEEAGHCFHRALALAPHDADAHNNLGTVLRRQGEFKQAEAEFRAAIANDSNHVEANCGLADLLQMRGLLDEAEACCKLALSARPNCADALNNLATIAKARDDLDAASAYCDAALRIDAQHLGALNNLAAIATRRAEHERARAIYRSALDINRSHAVTRFNAGVNLLMLGEYTEGFELYESRFDASGRRLSSLPALDQALRSKPQWHGHASHCRQLLVWAEQGLGDTLMMLRYLPKLRGRGVDSFFVLCDPSLEGLVACVDGVERIVTSSEDALAIGFEVHSPMMSLPRVFGTTATTIPNATPYVLVPQSMSAAWHRRVREDPRPSVGLVWAGSRTLQDDALRSMSFAEMSALLALERLRFVSLQKGDAATEWTGTRLNASLIDECADLLDTAALIAALNLVITVDTAVAHLAGALGKPVWLLNRFGSEWRWGNGTSRTAWYPSMRLFNQDRMGDWSGLINHVRTELHKFQDQVCAPGCL